MIKRRQRTLNTDASLFARLRSIANEIVLAHAFDIPSSAADLVLVAHAHRAAIARIANEFAARLVPTGMGSAVVGVARFCTVVGRVDEASERKQENHEQTTLDEHHESTLDSMRSSRGVGRQAIDLEKEREGVKCVRMQASHMARHRTRADRFLSFVFLTRPRASEVSRYFSRLWVLIHTRTLIVWAVLLSHIKALDDET